MFRHHSYFSDQAVAVIAGMGADGQSVAQSQLESRQSALAAAAGDYATGGQAAVLKHVRIDGEAEFANVLSTLLRNVRWDAAEDLSRVFGDVLAQRMVSGAQAVRTEAARRDRDRHRRPAGGAPACIAGCVGRPACFQASSPPRYQCTLP